MRLQRRQYIYLVVILALAIYNAVRVYRAHHVSLGTTVVYVDSLKINTPQWTAFDTAANLRDAPDAQFGPALQALTQSIDSSNSVAVPPTTTPPQLADLQGCRTWLLFYRQEFLHPSKDKPGWREQTTSHVASCSANHRDEAK